MKTKVCSTCGKRKLIGSFYATKSNADGYFGYCKPCATISSVRWSKNNPESVRVILIRSYAKNRSAKIQRSMDWKRRNPNRKKPSPNKLKQTVQNKTKWAIQSGRLIRKNCEVCGHSNVDAHHDDYSKPYDVRWLCHTHHMEHHRKYDYDATLKSGKPILRNTTT